MQRFVVTALFLATASPALAVSDRIEAPVERQAMVERLYPETDIEGEGWRGLLPIMLLNANLAARPQSAGADLGTSSAR